jgi:hypothetical protein
MRRRLFSYIGLILLALATARLGAQGSATSEPPMPATGLDFSGVDQFWRVVDILSKDSEPSGAQWQALLGTPGYRLAQIAIGKVVREDLEFAFKPSRRAVFDSLIALPTERAFRLKHLARAPQLRPQLDAFRDSVSRSAPIAEAIRTAQRFLPPGATSVGEPPLVAFAVFRDDGYSLGPGVIVDLIHAYESNLVLFLAHEFHHAYLSLAQAKTMPDRSGQPDRPNEFPLRSAIQALRNEGLADLIDKPYPLTTTNPVRAAYVTRYNDEYAKTPATLHQIDSLLVAIAGDSTQLAPAGQRVRTLLWSNAHPNGAYVARTIYEQFGVDSLFPAVTSPVAMLRTYAAAERMRGNPSPFSPPAWRVLE